MEFLTIIGIFIAFAIGVLAGYMHCREGYAVDQRREGVFEGMKRQIQIDAAQKALEEEYNVS